MLQIFTDLLMKSMDTGHLKMQSELLQPLTAFKGRLNSLMRSPGQLPWWDRET